MSLPHVKISEMRETKLVECGICKHEYLPIAHYNHCPICGVLKMDVGTKHHIYVNPISGRLVARPFMITRSLAETINSLSLGSKGV